MAQHHVWPREAVQAQSALAPQRRGPAERWQKALAETAQGIFRTLERVARHRLLVCAVMAILPMGIRFAALPWIPIPEPGVQDEYSYLLAADTFRSGRLTNATHPMWEHFETFHELMRPTYQSKYPPAQGMLLALGWKLFGHPWYGVWISFGLMCACVCWMLQGWLPPVYAPLGTLAAMGQVGIFGYWMDSYWGGAVAAAGGALVLGAMARVARRASLGASAAGSFGLVLLANSRPYEGLVMVAGAAVALVWWRRRLAMPRPLTGLLPWRNLSPFVLICGAGLLGMLYYNYRVTGNPWKMPYAAYYQQYAAVPQWYILPPNPQPPTYRNETIKRLWTEVEIPLYHKARRNPARIASKVVTELLPWYCSTLLFFAIAVAVAATRSLKVWLALGIGACVLGAALVETWGMPHYFAGGTALVFLLAMYGVRVLRVGGGRMGALLVLLFAATIFASGTDRAVAEFRRLEHPSGRQPVAQDLRARGGKHLVIVQYDANHEVSDDWVYNAADIDASPIVWARDMGPEKNRELLDYYRDRKAWLVHADAPVGVRPLATPPLPNGRGSDMDVPTHNGDATVRERGNTRN